MSTLSLLALALAAFTPPNADDVGGPLRLRNDFPFHRIFLSTPPLDARIPARPRLDVELGASNTYTMPYNISGSAAGQQMLASPEREPLDLAAAVAEAEADPGRTYHYVDTETMRLDVRYAVPFGGRWMLEVEAPLYMHSAGWMDSSVEGYHGLLGFDQALRDKAPQYSGQVFLSRGGSTLASEGQEGPALGDLTLRGLRLLAPADRGWPAVSLSAAVKAPTGAVSKVLGSGGWDGGLGLHLTHQWGQSWFYGTVGHTWHGVWRGMGGVPLRNSVDAHFGYEFRASQHWSALAALSYYGSPFDVGDVRSVGNAATNYAFAARFNDGRSYELEWGFTENVINNFNTHDFGVYTRLRFWP